MSCFARSATLSRFLDMSGGVGAMNSFRDLDGGVDVDSAFARQILRSLSAFAAASGGFEE